MTSTMGKPNWLDTWIGQDLLASIQQEAMQAGRLFSEHGTMALPPLDILRS